MVTPDGMASMAQERKHMREMRRLDQQAAPPWELAALDADGEELYRTEAFDTEAEAKSEASLLNDGGIPARLSDEIARFEAVRREE